MKNFKPIIFLMVWMLAIASAGLSQNIKGNVKGAISGEELPGATVIIKGTTTGATTDSDGVFNFKVDAGEHIVLFRFLGYETKQKTVNVPADGTLDMGTILLKSQSFGLAGVDIIADIARERETPVAFTNIKAKEIEEKLGSRDIPLVLNTTPSVYATPQGGGAGDARMNIRGFNQRNIAIMINGVPVNDMENGWVYWSNWDGLGDATQSIQVQRGLSAVNLATPSIGGTMNVVTNPAEQKEGVELKQEFASGNFMKTTAFAHTGLIDGKYALSGGMVRKTSDGVIDGTWADAWAYYFGASYSVNTKNRLEFYVMGAPQRHGQNLYKQNTAVYDQEFAKSLDSYDEAALANYSESKRGRLYNENWSYVDYQYNDMQWWNGKQHSRYSENFINERENFYHKPQINMNWYHQYNDDMSQYTTVYYSGGKGGGTGTYGDVVWDYASEPTRIVDYNATISQNMAADTALGILRNSRNNQWTIGAISKLTYKVSENIKTQFGVDWRTAEIDHFREVRDLLGGPFYVKTADGFNPGQNVGLGDKIAYNFTNTVDWGGIFGQAEYKNAAFSAYGMAGASTIKYTFTDHFTPDENGDKNFTESDFIVGYQIKGGANYNFTETLNAYGNVGYVSKVPIFDGVIRDSDGVLIDNPENEKFTSFEAGVQFLNTSETLSLKLNGYYTIWQDRAITVGIQDAAGNDAVISLLGMDQTHSGIEAEAYWNPFEYLNIAAMASFGNWLHTSDATGTYTDYTSGSGVSTEYNYYVKDLKVGDAPQTQMAISVAVKPVKELRIEGLLRYYSNHFAAWDPLGRTDADDRTQSWEAPEYAVVDLHAEYVLPVQLENAKLTAFAHIFNLLDEVYIQDATDNSRYNGFDGDHDADDAEVFLGLPRTVNAGIKLNF